MDINYCYLIAELVIDSVATMLPALIIIIILSIFVGKWLGSYVASYDHLTRFFFVTVDQKFGVVSERCY